MKNIFVDTNVLIDYSKGFGKKLKPLLEKQKENLVHLYINPIIIVEYMNDYNLINKEKVLKAGRFLQHFTLLDINKTIGFITAEILRKKQISFIGDAIIAATCLENKLELITNNKKDFLKIEGLNFYNWYKVEIEDFKNIKKVHKTLKEVRKKLF